MARFFQSASKASAQFWLLSCFLVLVFILGGSSRGDVQSLVILRPLAILMCAIAVTTLKREHLARQRWLLGGIGMIFLLTLIHMMPIPGTAAAILPGQDILSEIDGLAGIEGAGRAITLTPENGRNAFFTLFAPLAVILFGIQLDREDLYRLIPLLIGLGSLSGMFGLLQSIGDPNGALYFYRITNNGSAVGLFANRNHSAVLLACMFPLLAVFASGGNSSLNNKKSRELFSLVIAIVLVPLILVAGSRSGLLISAIGMLSAAVLYRTSLTGRRSKGADGSSRVISIAILASIAVAGLGLLTIFFSRAQAIERLFAGQSMEESRLDFWSASFELVWTYLPWGSGTGSFAEVFRSAEPQNLLDSTYLNRAHNDWIELAVTGGAPSLLLLGVAIILFFRRSFSLWLQKDSHRRSVAIARMAGIAMFMVAAASLADYPLRTPIMMCIFALFTLWFANNRTLQSKNDLTQ